MDESSLRNTLIDRLKAKPGDGHTTSELQHLDNRGLTEMAEATSSNATFWELARAILNLEPKYRQVISNEKIEDFSLWSIEEMRNTIIAVLEREAQIDVKALQAMSSNQLVGIIPRRLQRAREREHILERVKYSTPEYTQGQEKELWATWLGKGSKKHHQMEAASILSVQRA